MNYIANVHQQDVIVSSGQCSREFLFHLLLFHFQKIHKTLLLVTIAQADRLGVAVFSLRRVKYCQKPVLPKCKRRRRTGRKTTTKLLFLLLIMMVLIVIDIIIDTMIMI